MLVHPLFWLVNGSVRIATVVLSGRIVAVPHVLVSVVALGGDVWVWGVVINSSVTSVSYRIVTVGVLPVNVHVVGLQLVHRVVCSSSHLHLPKRVLGVHASTVVGVGVAVFKVSHVWP